MKKIFSILFILMIAGNNIYAQESMKIYDVNANAVNDIQQAIELAGQNNKHVLIQVGGNWCPWCIRLHDFFKSAQVVDSILTADYVLVRVNFSKENKNPEVMAQLSYPQRFGFPVLVVLDGKGNLLHTQDTGYLELDKGYDEDKVKRFLLGWNHSALNPDSYQY